MVVHTAGADDRCVACGERFPCPSHLASDDHIQPRRVDPNPRCAACQSGGMYHPMHRWRACDVRLPAGEFCGCTVTDRPLAL